MAWLRNNVISILAILFFIGAVAYTVFVHAFTAYQTAPLSVAQSLEVCSSANSDSAVITCGRTVIDHLLETYTTSELLGNISTGTVPTIFHDCHSIGHLIGQETFHKTDSLEKTLAACSSQCSSACIHGAVAAAVQKDLGASYASDDIQHLRGPEIKKIGRSYCTQSALCHGIGHILFLAYQNFPDALSGCDTIAEGFNDESCQQGVFMQGAGGIASSLAFETPAPVSDAPNDDYAYPCAASSEKYSHACFLYLQTYENILFERKGITDIKERLDIAIQTCKKFTGRMRADCFSGIGRSMGTHSVFAMSEQETRKQCASMPTESDQKACILGKVFFLTQFSDFTNTGNFCARIDKSLRTLCYNALFQFSTKFNESQTMSACAATVASSTCLTMLQKYQSIRPTLPDYRFGLYGAST